MIYMMAWKKRNGGKGRIEDKKGKKWERKSGVSELGCRYSNLGRVNSAGFGHNYIPDRKRSKIPNWLKTVNFIILTHFSQNIYSAFSKTFVRANSDAENKFGHTQLDHGRSILYFWPTPVKIIFNFFWGFVRENSRLENNFDRMHIGLQSVNFDDVIESSFCPKVLSIFYGAHHLKLTE